MTSIPVSICIVSWMRPTALQRCLTGISQLQYDNFEIVVVADAASLNALSNDWPIKTVQTDEANISLARNLGIMQSAGDVVAFIDDDAVPEPTWLSNLVHPFADRQVAATTGYVRGRNGISWQWRGRRVNNLGETEDHAPGDVLPKDWAIKTEGTNMAVRRSVLLDLGGFDPAYRFFLDETDLNIRLATRGHLTQIVPQAEVHHGFMPSARRRRDRVPTDLFEIGASWSVFLRKHASASELMKRIEDIRIHENARLCRHLMQGGLEPRDVRYLRRRLWDGISEGSKRVSSGLEITAPSRPEFLQYPSQRRISTVLSCSAWKARATLDEARERVRNGEIVTVYSLSITSFYHHLKFTKDGVWYQRGGLFGKSERDDRPFKAWTRKRRIASEVARVAKQRNFAQQPKVARNSA